MMANRFVNRQPYPTVLEVGERDPTVIPRVLNNAIAGNLNIVGEVQLLVGTTETTVRDPRISPQSILMWQALDAASAALIPSIWLKTRGVRECTIGHASPGASTWLEYAVFA
jgi:hypothetical protein